jgi:hypothetical protein
MVELDEFHENSEIIATYVEKLDEGAGKEAVLTVRLACPPPAFILFVHNHVVARLQSDFIILNLLATCGMGRKDTSIC